MRTGGSNPSPGYGLTGRLVYRLVVPTLPRVTCLRGDWLPVVLREVTPESYWVTLGPFGRLGGCFLRTGVPLTPVGSDTGCDQSNSTHSCPFWVTGVLSGSLCKLFLVGVHTDYLGLTRGIPVPRVTPMYEIGSPTRESWYKSEVGTVSSRRHRWE